MSGFDTPELTMGSEFAQVVGSMLEGVTGAASRVRVGIDVVCVQGFTRLLESRGGAAFRTSRFTPHELDYCGDRTERLAGRWAAKEAVAKAIGTGFRGLRPSSIEICHQSHGVPLVRRAPGADEWPDGADGWDWAISISHESTAAAAIAVGVSPAPLDA